MKTNGITILHETEEARRLAGYGEHEPGTCTATFAYDDGRQWFCGRSAGHRGRHSAIVLGKREYW